MENRNPMKSMRGGAAKWLLIALFLLLASGFVIVLLFRGSFLSQHAPVERAKNVREAIKEVRTSSEEPDLGTVDESASTGALLDAELKKLDALTESLSDDVFDPNDVDSIQ
jgi:hypothetical protein